MTVNIPTFTPRTKRGGKQPTIKQATNFHAYLRVSTRDQAEEGHGLDASRADIERWAAANGKHIIAYRPETRSGKDVYGRKVLLELFNRVANGDGDGIVVSKLDRLVRSTIDFAHLIVDAREQQWAIVALDVGLDMSTPHGELIATFMVGMAQWERRIIGQRTADGLAAARAKGVRLGRPVSLPDRVIALIIELVEEDPSRGRWARIARHLNEWEIPTAQGGRQWHPSVVWTTYHSQRSVEIATAMAQGDTF